ncbi:hypothetical protein HHK36_031295 [Tetracentron sinense]|uniref:Protein TIC 20 n=1 Tax=Tetracentron sinense TaxID=13715 RepID=A0A835CZF9_TETSI|nr:hypothetical protein HHK36_031295 [Tetracentron sinense]
MGVELHKSSSRGLSSESGEDPIFGIGYAVLPSLDLGSWSRGLGLGGVEFEECPIPEEGVLMSSDPGVLRESTGFDPIKFIQDFYAEASSGAAGEPVVAGSPTVELCLSRSNVEGKEVGLVDVGLGNGVLCPLQGSPVASCDSAGVAALRPSGCVESGRVGRVSGEGCEFEAGPRARLRRYLDMILNGCTMTHGSVGVRPMAHKSAFTCFSHVPVKTTFSSIRSSWRHCEELKSLPSGGWSLLHLSSASTPLLSGDQGSLSHRIPMLPRRHSVAHRLPMVPRASKDVPYSFRYPPMTKKPKWWWRAIACLPYLMPLHETWMYAETAYHLHPFLEDFEFLTYPFLGAIGSLPSWFLMAYFFAAYLGVVRKKEWPHFFRFHVVMGMLLEIALQVIGTVSRWMPLAVYWGKIGMHFWTAVAFAYLFTVLECIRCALAGMYADIPFVCDAAYIQIPYD